MDADGNCPKMAGKRVVAGRGWLGGTPELSAGQTIRKQMSINFCSSERFKVIARQSVW